MIHLKYNIYFRYFIKDEQKFFLVLNIPVIVTFQ